MGAVGVLVGGKVVTIPGVYPQVDASAMTPVLPGSAGIILVVGNSEGGDPGRVYSFNNFDDAATVIRGGRLLSYISRMFNASPDQAGASLVKFIRANQTPHQAALAVETSFTVTSRDYGAWTNGIRLTITEDVAGDATLPISGGTFKPWTILVENPAEKQSYTYRIRSGILVSSATKTGTLDVDHSTRLVTLTLNTTSIDVVDFDLVPTLKDLADWVARHFDLVCTVVGSSWYPIEVLNKVSITVGASSLFLPAEEGLAVYLLDSVCPLVSCAFLSGQYPGALSALAVTYLASGTGRASDSIESTGVARALTLAETTEAHLVFLQSTSASLQALALAHCAAMSSVDRRKYRIFVGGINFTSTSPVDGHVAAATTAVAVTTACDRARTLDGPCVLCFNGTVAANPITGLPEQLGGLGLAAEVIGMASGAYVATPLTNKAVIAQSREFTSLSDAQLEAMLDAGVLTSNYDSSVGRTIVVQAVTCYQSTNPSFRNFQGLRIQHQIARLWIRVLSRYIGWPLDLETGERIKADCAKNLDDSILSGSVPSGFITEGRLADGTRVPAWDSLIVTGDSTTGTWTITVNVHPVGETDYIVIRTRLTPAPIEL